MISDLEGDKSTFPKGLSTVGWHIHGFPLIFTCKGINYDLLKPFNENLKESCRYFEIKGDLKN